MEASPTHAGIIFLLITSIVKDVLRCRSCTFVESLALKHNPSSATYDKNRKKREISSTDNMKLLPQTNLSVPVLIETDVFVDDVNSFNALDMDFRLDFFLWQKWSLSLELCEKYIDQLEDVSIREGTQLLIPLKVMSSFWVPDTYITNAKTAATISNIPPTKSMKISKSKNGCQLEYTLRLAGKMACQMDFKDYPYDIQICPITFRSFSHSSAEMLYRWHNSRSASINPEILMLQHHIMLSKTELTREIFNLNYSVLIIQCQFIRNIDYYLIQVYAPSTLVVILSWFNFWLGLDIMAGRISLSVTSLLSLVTQFANVRKDLPPVSYVNVIDIWMITCIGFVIGSLLEVTSVRFINQSKSSEEMKTMSKSSSKPRHKKKKSSFKHNLQLLARNLSCSQDLDVTIDKISRALFPGAFIVFNLFYWPMMLNRAF